MARRAKTHWTYIGGIERGERNPTLKVIAGLATALGAPLGELLGDGRCESIRHPLEQTFNASAYDILSAVEKGFRAQVDVKGKLAEYFMDRRLSQLKRSKTILSYKWQDIDGQPDFLVMYHGRELRLECKNIRNETFKNPPSFKVELQKTRNSMDGTPTRGYGRDEFDVLGVSLFNQTGEWDYLWIAAKRLEVRPDNATKLQIMQRVPMGAPLGAWKVDPMSAFNEALK